MRKRAAASCGGLLFAVQAATAQVIFYEDFAGSSLGPQWTTTPNPANATYTVGNGRLTVDWMRPPLGGHAEPAMEAVFRAGFPAYSGDFHATVRFGWEPGSLRQVVMTMGSTSPNRLAAELVYTELGSWVGASVGGPALSIPAPPPGTHQFEVSREGTQVHFWFNSTYLGARMQASPAALDWFGFDVLYFHPGQSFQPVFLESVVIIPSPATWVGVGSIGLVAVRRRRCACWRGGIKRATGPLL
jgi:hypothetical protein